MFADDDLLQQVIVERMLAGVATRRHVLVAEPVGETLKARSVSKSAVSRRFIAATEAAMAELLSRDLSQLDVAVLMIDGVHFADDVLVVAMIITADGTKIPVGLTHGDTENSTVVKRRLADLVARGLRFEDGLLVVLDGSKALRKAVNSVFGGHAVVQRCTLHKRRNVTDYLPKEQRATMDRRLAGVFADPDPKAGLRMANSPKNSNSPTPTPPDRSGRDSKRCPEDPCTYQPSNRNCHTTRVRAHRSLKHRDHHPHFNRQRDILNKREDTRLRFGRWWTTTTRGHGRQQNN